MFNRSIDQSVSRLHDILEGITRTRTLSRPTMRRNSRALAASGTGAEEEEEEEEEEEDDMVLLLE
jgi:hypothetical protein